VRNTGADGGGLLADSISSLTVTGSTVADNTAIGDGGGLWAAPRDVHQPPAVVTIASSSIVDNHAGEDGGGIAGSASLTSAIVARNDAKRNGGGVSEVLGIRGVVSLASSYIIANTAGVSGGGVHHALLSTDGVSEVIGNSPDDVAN
jgi:hypothetical protein